MFELINHGVKKHTDLILEAEQYIWKNPETGYKEWKTSKYMENIFEKLGYSLTRAGDIPGFYTDIDTNRPGPKILILGELDSLICGDHPDADPATGAVHCCGHNAQCAALVGIAAVLKEKGVLNNLCGSIRLCAVPAEEGIEISYRDGLINQGVISYFSGKPEFLHRGYFDGADIAFMIHTTAGKNALIKAGSVGNIRKAVRYKGVSAHAGGSPHAGVNALYAATLGLQAINSIRETFREKDLIRVHPIITKGGEAVNAIPADVTIESYVRGKTFDAFENANKRVNRALIGAAVSMGANVDISDKTGYYPLQNDKNLMDITKSAMEYVMGKERVTLTDSVDTGSTDMGDLSAIMPVIHPYMPGAIGESHGKDYAIENKFLACVESARVQLVLLHMLLCDNASKAKQVLENKQVPFKSKEEYFAKLKTIETSGERIKYSKDGFIGITV
ncbi:MAG: amidohydrolase [Firmicutes bacterium]|nr:amidohydrolase [Bacillota bacterium]